MDTAALNASTLLAPEPGEDLLPEDAPGQKEDLLPEDAVLADFMGWATKMEKARLAEAREERGEKSKLSDDPVNLIIFEDDPLDYTLPPECPQVASTPHHQASSPKESFPAEDIRKSLDKKKQKKLQEANKVNYTKARVLRETRKKREKLEREKKTSEKNARKSLKERLGPRPPLPEERRVITPPPPSMLAPRRRRPDNPHHKREAAHPLPPPPCPEEDRPVENPKNRPRGRNVAARLNRDQPAPQSLASHPTRRTFLTRGRLHLSPSSSSQEGQRLHPQEGATCGIPPPWHP